MPNFSIIIVLNVIISAFLGIFVLMPKYQNYKDIESQVSVKNAELRDKEEHYADIENNSQELKNYREALAKVDSALPEDPFLPSLFRYLGNQASQSGLVMKEVKAAPPQQSPEQKANVQTAPINVSLSGAYPSFKEFISNIEKSARLIEVKSVMIRPGQEKNLDFILSLQTQYYKPAQ